MMSVKKCFCIENGNFCITNATHKDFFYPIREMLSRKNHKRCNKSINLVSVIAGSKNYIDFAI